MGWKMSDNKSLKIDQQIKKVHDAWPKWKQSYRLTKYSSPADDKKKSEVRNNDLQVS